jgi:hypothetical protein
MAGRHASRLSWDSRLIDQDGMPCDIDDMAGVEALTLLDSVQPELCRERQMQIWEKRSSSGGAAEGNAADDGACA